MLTKKKRVIELRYAVRFRENCYGVEVDKSVPRMSFNNICLQTGVLPGTARKMVSRFLANGNLIKSKSNYKRRGNLPKLSDHLVTKLMSKRLLKSWSHLTLVQRVAEIERKFKVSISKDTLRNYYKANDVSYRTIGFSWYHRNRDLLKQQ